MSRGVAASSAHVVTAARLVPRERRERHLPIVGLACHNEEAAGLRVLCDHDLLHRRFARSRNRFSGHAAAVALAEPLTDFLARVLVGPERIANDAGAIE